MADVLQRRVNGEKVLAPLKTFADLEFHSDIWWASKSRFKSANCSFENGYSVRVHWPRPTDGAEVFTVRVSRSCRDIPELYWNDLSSREEVTTVIAAVQMLSVDMGWRYDC